MLRAPCRLCLVAVALALACGADEAAPPDPGWPVRILEVPQSGAGGGSLVPGRAEASEHVELGFEVSGRMVERPVELGSRVEEGQVVARLDQREFRDDLARAVAARDRTAQRLVRVSAAVESGAVSEQDLTDAEAQAEEAAALVDVSQKALDDSTLRAPFDGVVAATYIEAFQEVERRQPVLRLLDVAEIEMWIQVPEAQIASIRKGDPATLTFDALPDLEIEGQIDEIGREADSRKRTYPVSIRFDQPESTNVLPGMAGEAALRFDTEASAAASTEVPLSAVFSDEGNRSFAWVLDDSGSRVELRAVETGDLTEDGIMIVQGLSPGEKLVVGGGQFLHPGAPVRLVGNGESSQ